MSAAVSSEILSQRSHKARLQRADIAAIIAPCSALKTVEVDRRARAVSLPVGPQRALETAWVRRVAELPATVVAGDFYRGRGFATAMRAAHRADAEIFVASAGLGLVRAGREIPAYGLTVANVDSPDAVRRRVTSRFDPASWWRAIQGGPHSTDLKQVLVSNGLVLIALSHTYAELLSEDLNDLDDDSLGRIRIFGLGLSARLPARVQRASLLPYDDRLDRVLPGVRGDFCQRALSHFVDLLHGDRRSRQPDDDIRAHRALVEAALGRARDKDMPPRMRASDATISNRITARLSIGACKLPSASVLLEKIRNEDGIACEASRFSRLYRLAAGIKSEGSKR